MLFTPVFQIINEDVKRATNPHSLPQPPPPPCAPPLACARIIILPGVTGSEPNQFASIFGEIGECHLRYSPPIVSTASAVLLRECSLLPLEGSSDPATPLIWLKASWLWYWSGRTQGCTSPPFGSLCDLTFLVNIFWQRRGADVATLGFTTLIWSSVSTGSNLLRILPSLLRCWGLMPQIGVGCYVSG